ncbi:YgiT-type zinc finger protein [Desulfobacterota bacterium AH_259_B03_O07]|nr:YgiT-type zinc finger protein [Desulfobacterota bacterium AH_259_B03_O07]
MKTKSRKCRRRECNGKSKASFVTQVFERHGSAVQVIIKNIPASVCPECGDETLSMETLKEISKILRPLHGVHKNIPKLPPAEIFIDFAEAIKARSAA